MADAPVKNRPVYREYRSALGKLTFNSKPIINDLSKKAETYVNDADSVLKAIEDHLRFTVPNYKLPAFYLLDSIAKNVGNMYIPLLHGRLGKIFVDMWRSVDDPVRAKMERTLGTWRNGFEGGKDHLFPEFVLRKIEEDIGRLKARAKETAKMVPDATSDNLLDNLTGMQTYAKKRALEERQQQEQRAVVARAESYNSGSHRRHTQQNGHKRQRTPDKTKEVHNHELLQQINSMIMKKKVEMLRRPNDTYLFAVHDTLKEYKAMVMEVELPPERVSEIREHLAVLENMNSGNKPSNGSTTPPYPPPSSDPRGMHGVSANGNAAEQASMGTDSAANNAEASQLLQNIMAQPDLLNKLNGLNSLGKLASNLPSSLGTMLVPQNPDGIKDFTQLEPIPLTQASITRTRPGIYDILYAGYGNQCSQCGWRTKEGDADEMKKHLDWHFRRNLRQQNDRERRASPRGWYMEQSQWEQGAVEQDQQAAETMPTEKPIEEAERTAAELQRMVVAAPSSHNEPCRVCKEAFERRFNEDDEIWELVNAVVVDGSIIHATCNAKEH
ncbi:mRNA 3' end processing factor [Coemansia sp. RSA 1821]|nr:mRNA 3' end processing factor [Coemansia sp. RSA 1086]KAJ1748235.1 mRNA 3' end processing factor [Coemansia sp. RSA 1821]KAJ2646520.1 mRNA 3' end processing factor [Coemansia sp. RSA 1250]KAJ2669009.1 mRNA 3' end processing factor [Coemansia sp. RSA 1085]